MPISSFTHTLYYLTTTHYQCDATEPIQCYSSLKNTVFSIHSGTNQAWQRVKTINLLPHRHKLPLQTWPIGNLDMGPHGEPPSGNSMACCGSNESP